MDIYGLEFEIDKVCGFFDVFFFFVLYIIPSSHCRWK